MIIKKKKKNNLKIYKSIIFCVVIVNTINWVYLLSIIFHIYFRMIILFNN